MESVQGHIDKALDVGRRRVAGHHNIPEGIHRGLDEHIGDGEQGALNTGRQADADDFLQLGSVEAHFAQNQLAGVGAAHQRNSHQNGGNGLGNGGSQGNTSHVQMQSPDKKDIEQHIDNAGKGQVKQRAFGISRRPQNGGAEVIDHGEGDAPKIDLHVYGGQGQHSVRGSHHPQKGLRKKNAENGQNDAADQCRGHGGMYCAVDDPILLAAQAMGHGDTRAYGQTDEEIYH